jgi:hypothetical protein
MSEEVIVVGDPYPTDGVHHDYSRMRPQDLIIKVQGSIDAGHVTIRAVVNVNYEGEHYFEDEADLEDGDMIFATKEGLVVLRDASEDNLPEWNGRRICIGMVYQNALILYPTVEP